MKRDTILFTDSKGDCLKDVIPNFVGRRFKILSRPGATIFNRRHVKALLKLVKDCTDPIVLVWLGTCEVIKKDKVDKYIYTHRYPYQNIEFALTEYREVEIEIPKANPLATVYYLECPYYSITRANKAITRQRIENAPIK